MIDHERALEGIEALYAVGHWLIERGQFHDAAAVLRNMVQLAPTDDRGWLALGVCHEQVNQHDVALEMYGTGAALCSRSVRCRLARARLLRRQGDEADADEVYGQAAELAADDEELEAAILQERAS